MEARNDESPERQQLGLSKNTADTTEGSISRTCRKSKKHYCARFLTLNDAFFAALDTAESEQQR